jgi:hypothetical protein
METPQDKGGRHGTPNYGQGTTKGGLSSFDESVEQASAAASVGGAALMALAVTPVVMNRLFIKYNPSQWASRAGAVATIVGPISMGLLAGFYMRERTDESRNIQVMIGSGGAVAGSVAGLMVAWAVMAVASKAQR